MQEHVASTVLLWKLLFWETFEYQSMFQRKAHAWREIIDERGAPTVLPQSQVLAPMVLKRVSCTISAKRGQVMINVCFCRASDTTMPPVPIFQRIEYKARMLYGGSPGVLGLANQSRWVSGNTFLKSVKHFVKHTKSEEICPIVLRLDNHNSNSEFQPLKWKILLHMFPGNIWPSEDYVCFSSNMNFPIQYEYFLGSTFFVFNSIRQSIDYGTWEPKSLGIVEAWTVNNIIESIDSKYLNLNDVSSDSLLHCGDAEDIQPFDPNSYVAKDFVHMKFMLRKRFTEIFYVTQIKSLY